MEGSRRKISENNSKFSEINDRVWVKRQQIVQKKVIKNFKEKNTCQKTIYNHITTVAADINSIYVAMIMKIKLLIFNLLNFPLDSVSQSWMRIRISVEL